MRKRPWQSFASWWLRFLIRQKRIPILAVTVGALAIPMIETPFRTLLVTAVGLAALQAARAESEILLEDNTHGTQN
jgi:hypothetical protein